MPPPFNTKSHETDTLRLMAEAIADNSANLLAVIRCYRGLLMHTVAFREDQRPAIDQIVQALRQATSLTTPLLALSHRQIVQPVAVDLNLVITNLDQVIRRLIWEHNIWLSTVAAPSLGLVRADPIQLEQILLILVMNARDAMPQGGELRIETANVELDDTFVRNHPGARPGPYVRLVVRDTGRGINEATRVRMFDPVFLTNGDDKVTGFEFSIIYGIVKQSGGYITVNSEPGRGTTFEIYLPRVGDAGDMPDTLDS
jgi:two-component system, cell cycle sensor histidine kinase and response regulator CckA